jgi:2-keto-4-pentenoate hydratase
MIDPMSNENTADPRIVAGMEAQGQVREEALASGDARLGWKAGLGTEAAMAKVGTSAPVAGFLTGGTLVASGATIAVGAWANPALEPEVAVRLGADVGAGATAAEVRAAIDAVGPAIELVDLGAPDDLEAVLAGNVFHRAVVLGPLAPVPEGGLDAVRLSLALSDRPAVEGIDPRAVLGDLAEVVAALADQIPLAGTTLQAGDVIITGSAVPAIALGCGEDVEVALEGAGAVEVRLR